MKKTALNPRVCYDREEEKATLTTLLKSDARRILILSGPHNVGKSTLSMHVVSAMCPPSANSGSDATYSGVIVNLRSKSMDSNAIAEELRAGVENGIQELWGTMKSRLILTAPGALAAESNETVTALSQASVLLDNIPKHKKLVLLIDEFHLLLGLTERDAVKRFFQSLIDAVKRGNAAALLATSDSNVIDMADKLGIRDYSSFLTLWDPDPIAFIGEFATSWAASGSNGWAPHEANAMFGARLDFAETHLPQLVQLLGPRWYDVSESLEELATSTRGVVMIQARKEQLLASTQVGESALDVHVDSLSLVQTAADLIRDLGRKDAKVLAACRMFAEKQPRGDLGRPPQASEAAIEAEGSMSLTTLDELVKKNILFRQCGRTLYPADGTYTGAAYGPASMALWHAMRLV
jgi:archaellum biogenesis ATPase FlaH